MINSKSFPLKFDLVYYVGNITFINYYNVKNILNVKNVINIKNVIKIENLSKIYNYKKMLDSMNLYYKKMMYRNWLKRVELANC